MTGANPSAGPGGLERNSWLGPNPLRQFGRIILRERDNKMAAMLDKNRPDGKPEVLPDGLTNREIINCPRCQVSFTLAYGAGQHRIENGQNVVNLMHSSAHELISENHPPHMDSTYVWGETKLKWLDREQATAAGK
jgi:hypothetical protein